MEDLQELRQEYHAKRKELAQLRSQLHPLNEEKEKLYQQLKSGNDKLKSLLTKAAQLRQQRDDLTQRVKALKGEREKLNKDVLARREDKKKADERKKVMLQKLEVTPSPAALKAEIKRLESKLETEVLPFKQEQQLTKYLKELKAKLKKLGEANELWKEANTSAADFTEARRIAEKSHQQIQELARQSQQRHEEMTVLLKEVKVLRAQEKAPLQQYQQHKASYLEIKRVLDQVSLRLKELSGLLQEEKEKDFTAKLKERTAEIDEKIKKRKKLSTEDILAFQATKE